MIPLATIAGTSIGRSASRTAWMREAPRSRAASSYCGPIASSRARTMMMTNTSEKVMCPIACAGVPSGMNVSRCTKTSRSAVPITISGVTRVAKRDPARGPRAAAAPACEPDGEREPERDRDEHRDGGEPQALHERGAQLGVVQDGQVGVARVPAQRPALGGRARPALVEREADRDEDRDDRPDEVERREEDEEARLPPRIRPPVADASHAPPSLRPARAVA